MSKGFWNRKQPLRQLPRPYPLNGDREQQRLWYMVEYGILAEAVRQGHLAPRVAAVVLSCLKAMQSVSLTPPAPVATLAPAVESTGVEFPEVSALTPEQEARLERAFRLSRESITQEPSEPSPRGGEVDEGHGDGEQHDSD